MFQMTGAVYDEKKFAMAVQDAEAPGRHHQQGCPREQDLYQVDREQTAYRPPI